MSEQQKRITTSMNVSKVSDAVSRMNVRERSSRSEESEEEEFESELNQIEERAERKRKCTEEIRYKFEKLEIQKKVKEKFGKKAVN